MSFREKSRLRKIIYLGLIVLLFSAMYVHRVQVVEAKADDNNLAETNLGDLDLGGSAANYALVSFRGPLVTMLWWEADELKERHEWDKHKVIVTAISKLQPHFRGPWEYQGWNLAYNVSVEFDRAEDKYDYITQGTQWLVQGERMTRYRFKDKNGERKVVGDPVLRDYIGHVIQTKMTLADESDFYRCFYQLSCIPPNRWDPNLLSRDAIKTFKTNQYPQLARRIRNLKSIPEGAETQFDQELVRFLRDHQGMASRYDWREYANGGRVQLKEDRLQQWPLWPDMNEVDEIDLEEEQNQNPLGNAYWWYAFSQEPLPPPGYEKTMTDEQVKKDRRYRLPRMNMLIFRARPALTRTHHATDLGKIGVFRGRYGSQERWREAHAMWTKYEQENNLEVLTDLNQRAELYRSTYPHLARNNQPPPEDHLNEEMRRSFLAHVDVSRAAAGREIGRSTYRRKESEVNQGNECVEARIHFYDGSHRYRGDLSRAAAEYEQGLNIWQRLIVRQSVADVPAAVVFNALGQAAGNDGLNGLVGMAAGDFARELRPDQPSTLFVQVMPVSRALAPFSALPLGAPGAFDVVSWQLPLALASGDESLKRVAALRVRMDYEPFDRTPFGIESQVQEDTWELVDNYLAKRAKKLTPGYLFGSWIAWEHYRTLGQVGLAPQMAGVAFAGLPDPRFLAVAKDSSLRNFELFPLSVVSLDWVENMLEEKPTRIEKYLNPVWKRLAENRSEGTGRNRPQGPRPGDMEGGPGGPPGRPAPPPR